MSNSIEENFGICIIEAMIYGTYPLLPRGLSHTELAGNNPALLYDDLDEVVSKVKYLLETPYPAPSNILTVNHYAQSLNRIINEIKVDRNKYSTYNISHINE
jgi:hypothetical protein